MTLIDSKKLHYCLLLHNLILFAFGKVLGLSACWPWLEQNKTPCVLQGVSVMAWEISLELSSLGLHYAVCSAHKLCNKTMSIITNEFISIFSLSAQITFNSYKAKTAVGK